MNNEQIAHDLAIARLYGSKLETKELVKMYRQYKDEILSVLNSDSQPMPKAKIMKPI